MPGSIQSIERAAAILHVLGAADEPLGLAEIAASVSLAKPTAHGILRTLLGVGFVDQDHVSGKYALGDGLQRLGSMRIDAQELRSLAMSWADELASRTGLAVLVGSLARGEVLVAHHVFRRGGSRQQPRTGERLPAHATALGKVLLANAPVAARHLRGSGLTRYTGRTLTVPSRLTEALVAARQDGYAVENAEHVPDQGSLAAPVRGPGGMVVGALGVVGRLERVLDTRHRPRRRVLEGTLHAAGAISDALVDLWGD